MKIICHANFGELNDLQPDTTVSQAIEQKYLFKTQKYKKIFKHIYRMYYILTKNTNAEVKTSTFRVFLDCSKIKIFFSFQCKTENLNKKICK